MNKPTPKFRPYLTGSELTVTVHAIEYMLNKKVFSSTQEEIELHASLMSARRALKKVQINAEAGMSIAYVSSPREKKFSFESLGGTPELKIAESGIKSDKEKIESLSPKEEKIFWLEEEFKLGIRSREETDSLIEEIKSQAQTYVSNVIPRNESEERKEITDSELGNAISGVLRREE